MLRSPFHHRGLDRYPAEPTNIQREARYPGEDVQKKYQMEASGKYGVLLGGRTELLASLPAVYDSPILGHGSWAKDRIYYIGEVRALELLRYKGALDISREELIDGLTPAHRTYCKLGFTGVSSVRSSGCGFMCLLSGPLCVFILQPLFSFP